MVAAGNGSSSRWEPSIFGDDFQLDLGFLFIAIGTKKPSVAGDDI